MVLDTTLINTQQYKVRIEGKVEQFRERSSAFPTTWCSSYEKGSLLVANFTYLMYGIKSSNLKQIIFQYIGLTYTWDPNKSYHSEPVNRTFPRISTSPLDAV